MRRPSCQRAPPQSAPATACDQRLFHQRLAGDVVQHITTVVNDAVLPVGGVRVEGNIGNRADFWDCGFSARPPLAVQAVERSQAASANSDFSCPTTGNSASAGIPKLRLLCQRRSRSIDQSRSTPGIDGTASRCPLPQVQIPDKSSLTV